MWRLALEVRVNTHSILYSDTCFTAQALVRLMLDLQDKYLGIDPNEFVEQGVPRFDDVYGVFEILNKNLLGKGFCGLISEPIYKCMTINLFFFFYYLPTDAKKLLHFRPVYRKQQENFDRVLKCVTHLIYLLVVTATTKEEKQLTFNSVQNLVKNNLRSACTNDTLLHLCVSRLNIIKSGYFADGTTLGVTDN